MSPVDGYCSDINPVEVHSTVLISAQVVYTILTSLVDVSSAGISSESILCFNISSVGVYHPDISLIGVLICHQFKRHPVCWHQSSSDIQH